MKMTMLKLHILNKISDSSKANPYALIKEISIHNRYKHFFSNKIEIKDSVYNAINSLENSGYIKASKKIEDRKLKKYYTLTKTGKDSLKTAKKLFRKNIADMASIIGR
jgi:DNA-binding PadR family transcriptional regulator